MSDSRYLAEVWGGCLGPALPDGTRLWVDATEAIKPLDLCMVVLRDSKGPWDKFMREAWSEAMGPDYPFPNTMVKLFLARTRMDDRDVLLLGQLYPPCVGVVGLDEVEALHRVHASDGEGPIRLCARAEELEAFKLIAPFRSRDTVEPINPDWRPPQSQREAA